MFKFDSVKQSSNGNVVKVTKATLEQIEHVGGERGLRQANVAIIGKVPERNGLTIKIGSDVYKVNKGKGNNIWVSHQDAKTIEDFQKLFNNLSATPDKEVSAVIE